jgi:hypothetical protein
MSFVTVRASGAHEKLCANCPQGCLIVACQTESPPLSRLVVLLEITTGPGRRTLDQRSLVGLLRQNLREHGNVVDTFWRVA